MKKNNAQVTKKPARVDSHRVRLLTGEAERPNGGYVYRWTDKNQKRHAIYANSLEELREKEAHVVADELDGIRQEKKLLTVNELFNLWNELKRGLKDSTQKNYIYMYEAFVKDTFGKRRVVTVRKSDVKRFYNYLVDERGLKVSTVDGIHNVLHQVFQVAVDDNIIRGNPTALTMKELKKEYGSQIEPREALTVAQQRAFFEYLLHHPLYKHWYPVFFIMANTGMRIGEITGLRWCDVDLEKRIISVNHTLVYYDHKNEKGCYFSINTPKTDAGRRDIPITDAVKSAFIMEKEFHLAGDIKCNAQVDGYDDFIFINRFGLLQNQSALNRALKRIIRDYNLEIIENASSGGKVQIMPNFTTHVLRHSFATRCAESGMSLKSLQYILGHVDIKTTMNIYVDSTEDARNADMVGFTNYLKEKAM